MFLFLQVSVLLSLVLTAVLCFQLWPHRKVLLPKVLLVNMSLYFMWAFWVALTLLAEDQNLRVVLTKVRQVTNPFITATWIIMAWVVFYRPFWDRYKKWSFAVYVLPTITSLCTVLSLFGWQSIEKLLAFDFQEIPSGGGLLSYQVGPLLKLQFLYGGSILIILYAVYFLKLFSGKAHIRKYAFLFMAGGALPVLMELVGRYFINNNLLVQLNAGMSWSLVLVIYYGVSRLEFLNIKSFAQQRVFDNLPNPVLTLTPRMEIWDANAAAKKVFQIEDRNLGLSILGDKKFDFVFAKSDQMARGGKTYQIFRHEIRLQGGNDKGVVVVLSDVTEITDLNNEMEEHNQTLKELNAEIWRITNFNRKIQTVLSHDMTGVLASIHSLAKTGPETNQYNDKILQASSSSMHLLKNILSWSHEENLGLVEVSKSVKTVLAQLSSQILDKNIQVNVSSLEDPLNREYFIHGSTNMIEAVFRNLLANAIKYSLKEGVVVIALQEIDGHIEVKISDAGEGMSPEDIENILAHKAVSTERRDGYGVGLRFTLEFVEQLKGRFGIESEPGMGTTVRLSLPLHRT